MAVNGTASNGEPESLQSTPLHATAVNQARPNGPHHPFYRLPAELILDIIDLLPPDAFINFAFANYPFLHANGLAPALSRERIEYISNRTNIPALFPLFRMPTEIVLEIMRNLKPIDIMRFVLANYQDLARQGITPALTEETLLQLRNAVKPGLGQGS